MIGLNDRVCPFAGYGFITASREWIEHNASAHACHDGGTQPADSQIHGLQLSHRDNVPV